MSTPRPVAPWSAAAFEARYKAHPDPWNFAQSTFEQERFDRLLASLPRRFYNRAFEPGCANGVLTEKLARRCGTLVSTDVSETALAFARERCRGLRNVKFFQCDLINESTFGPQDLVVFSEIGYYFDRVQLREIVDRLSLSLSRRGHFFAAHWLGHSRDHRLDGQAVTQAIDECARLRLVLSQRFDAYEFACWIRCT